jgi:hypothetical protein
MQKKATQKLHHRDQDFPRLQSPPPGSLEIQGAG